MQKGTAKSLPRAKQKRQHCIWSLLLILRTICPWNHLKSTRDTNTCFLTFHPHLYPSSTLPFRLLASRKCQHIPKRQTSLQPQGGTWISMGLCNFEPMLGTFTKIHLHIHIYHHIPITKMLSCLLRFIHSSHLNSFDIVFQD